MAHRRLTSSPLVTVVMACYNSERYLHEAIDSVLGQTYRNLELLIVDDCSSDSTVAIVQDYIAADSRVRLIQRQARGGRPAVTKNSAIEHIRGQFVCFLDHDDYYGPEKIETLLALLEANPDCVAAFHDIDLVDGSGAFLNRYLDGFVGEAKAHLQAGGDRIYFCDDQFFRFQSIHYAALHTISVMIALERISSGCLQFDTQYKVCDDTDLWIRLGLEGRMIYVDRPLASYRQHSSNITRDQLGAQEDAIRCLLSNFWRMQANGRMADMTPLKVRISNYYSDAGWAYRRKRESGKSFLAYLKAWRWSGSPRHLVHAAKAFLPPRES